MAEKAKGKKSNPIQSYFRETVGELRKVSWPTRREAMQLTGLVIVVMVVVGIYPHHLIELTRAAAKLLI